MANGLSPAVDVAVIGAGAMGAGIAQVAAVAGHRIRLYDSRSGAAASAVLNILSALNKLADKGRMSHDAAAATAGRISQIDDLAQCGGCGLSVEAIVENLDAKRTLFRKLELVLAPDAILATNTSSISVTAIGAGLRHPERLAGLHFFNPAPQMPLVEVISGTATSAAVCATLMATASSWGKIPVRARNTPGFIVNRVARPFYAEGLRLLSEGAGDCATIDALIRESGGFRMGPFELMDLIGHDVNYAVTRSVFDAYYGDPRFTPSLKQLELVDAGFLGRKSGRGFYDYREGVTAVSASTLAHCAPPRAIRLFSGTLADALAARLAQTGIAFERLGFHVDGRCAEADGAVIYRTDGRTATARSASGGLPNTVLVDLALDDQRAARLGITVADQADPATLPAAAGLLQAAGYAVSWLDDLPGMAVMRTVAMLANEAADAVHQGVCSAADADLAMCKGVNYPRGPLAWADGLGIGTVLTVLDNLAQAYGEDRYRASPLLRRKQQSAASFHQTQETIHG